MRSSNGSGRQTQKPTCFDFGNYPMTPWMNDKDNPGQKTMKVEDVKKKGIFLTPKPRDDLFVV